MFDNNDDGLSDCPGCNKRKLTMKCPMCPTTYCGDCFRKFGCSCRKVMFRSDDVPDEQELKPGQFVTTKIVKKIEKN